MPLTAEQVQEELAQHFEEGFEIPEAAITAITEASFKSEEGLIKNKKKILDEMKEKTDRLMTFEAHEVEPEMLGRLGKLQPHIKDMDEEAFDSWVDRATSPNSDPPTDNVELQQALESARQKHRVDLDRVEGTYKKQIDKLNTAVAEAGTQFQRYVKMNELTTAIAGTGITDEDYMRMLVRDFESKVELVDPNPESLVVEIEHEPLSEYFKRWAGGPGKKFIPAPMSDGGNAPGSKGGPDGGPTKPVGDMSRKEKVDYYLKHGKEGLDQLAQQ